MGGFGDLFEGLGQLIGGVVQGVRAMEEAQNGGEAVNESAAAYAGMERYLAGGPKPLNVNDI